MADSRLELAGVDGISNVLLCKLWKRFKESPELINDVPSRYTMQRDILREFRRFGQTILLPVIVNGQKTQFTWHCTRPQDVLKYLCEKSTTFAHFLDSKLDRTEPAQMIISYDEITGGNVLRPDNKRKFVVFSCSIKCFGTSLASKSCLWMPFAVLRSAVVKGVRGGLSRCKRDLLRTAFGLKHKIPSGDGLQDGFVLSLPSGPRLVTVHISNNLADEAALSTALGFKGASGLLPCLGCKNIVMRGSKRQRASTRVHEVSCADPKLFDERTDADCIAAVRLVKKIRRTMSPDDFEESQKQLGITHNPLGVLADKRIRHLYSPMGTLTYDPMHTYLQSGVCNTEVFLLLRSMKPHGISWSTISEFCRSNITWPQFQRDKGSRLHECFSETRRKNSITTFKAGASEMLGLMPLIDHFLTLLPENFQDALKPEIASFHQLHKCVGYYLLAKKGNTACDELARNWAESETAHMKAFNETYGADKAKPKHHFRMHFPAQHARDKMMLDCFPLERSYHTSKMMAQRFRNTKQFERSVLTYTLIQQVRELNRFQENGLVGSIDTNISLGFAVGDSDAKFACRVDCKSGMHIASGPPHCLADFYWTHIYIYIYIYMDICVYIYIVGRGAWRHSCPQ
jgi:hypothetical protein